MKSIEELSMNAWPSLQTLLYDGWVIRFAGGYTKRANSVNPIYSSTVDCEKKRIVCERLFATQGLKTTFKITPAIQPENLDSLLEKHGYALVDRTSLQLMELGHLPEPELTDIVATNQLTPAWLTNYTRLNEVNAANTATLQKMLGLLIPKTYFVMLRCEGQVVACGMGVIEDEYIGLFDIIVDRNYRQHGFGRQLLLNILKLGVADGAKHAYLQVMLGNLPAVNLYAKLGFKEQYQYWYRVK